MNIKLGSSEDFSVTTKGGGNVFVPNNTGADKTLATTDQIDNTKIVSPNGLANVSVTDEGVVGVRTALSQSAEMDELRSVLSLPTTATLDDVRTALNLPADASLDEARVAAGLSDPNPRELAFADQVPAVSDRAFSTAVAPAFSTSSQYVRGDYVTRDGQLYKCSVPEGVTVSGAWDSADWTAVAVTDEMVDSVPTSVPDYASVAADFSTSKTYAVGNIVKYDGALYRCTTRVSTAGAWDSSKWTTITTADVTKPMRGVWYGTCTSSSTRSLVVTTTTGDFVYQHGNIVVVRFANGLGDYGNDATLSVDGGSGKYIKCASSLSPPNRFWGGPQVIAFVYDETNTNKYFRPISHQRATTTYYGMVLLNDTVSNDSSTAATPAAVAKYVDDTIGDINSVLDAINGEVI